MDSPASPSGIPGAVVAFVVVAHAGHEALLEQRLQDLGAHGRVLAHEPPVLVAQAARLEQDAVGDGDLADVVQVGDLFHAVDELL